MATTTLKKVKGSVSNVNANSNSSSITVTEENTAGTQTGVSATVSFNGVDVDLPKVGSVVEITVAQITA